MIAVAVGSLVCAGLPALLYFRNARQYRPPPPAASDRPAISVLIPARNEEAGIEAAARAALASVDVDVEVIVLDDHSTDRTAEIVRTLAAVDSRVRLAAGDPLPPGWAGKQFACFTLSALARHPVLAFLDADVRLEPPALARLDAFRVQSAAALVSGFPRQLTGTLLERLLIPLMHFVLLGFLPLGRMRIDPRPSLGAGCGQLFLTTADSYRQVGGHSHPLVRGSFHDGVKLPRAYRSSGRMTDLCDVTELASCRMYRSAGQVWRGLAKNAGEGLGKWPLILFATVLLAVGQVVPFAGVAAADTPVEMLTYGTAAILALAPRLHAAARFRQSFLGAVLHPVGITFFLLVQWYSFARSVVGRPVGWKDRPRPGLSSGA
jgi:Glycosyl transferase family 2